MKTQNEKRKTKKFGSAEDSFGMYNLKIRSFALLVVVLTFKFLVFSFPALAEEYPVCTEELPRADVPSGPCRPYPCNTCYEQMPEPFTLYCADQFQPEDVITYLETEGPTVIKNWGGSIKVDLSNTELPLVGRTQLAIADKEEEEKYRVQEYLADYFEGPVFYDQEPVDLETEDPEKLGNEIQRVLSYGGVFRKLAPKDLQDKLRENMIYRASEEKEPRWSGPKDRVHNYVVVYVKGDKIVSPGTPESEEIRLLDFLGHLRPVREDFSQDDEGSQAYQNALNGWKESEIKGVKLSLLWAYIPMFSRENVPGLIEIELEKTHGNDSLTITSPPENQKVYLPHLARLFEVSDQVYKIFRIISQKLTSFKEPLIAQPMNLPQSESRVLSTSYPEFDTCDHENVSLWNPGDKICGRSITGELSATEEFTNPDYRPFLPQPESPEVPCGECITAFGCPPGYYCLNTCCVEPPKPKVFTKEVSRDINIYSKIPFLDELWKKIVIGKEENGGALQSIFRIFFHEQDPHFGDLDYPGISSLTYTYKDSTEFLTAGDDKKGNEAKIYYPHLGGIRCIRDIMLERLLPADEEFIPFCEAREISIPTGPTPTPGAIAGGCGVCGAPIESETLVQIFGQAGSAFNVPGSILAGIANFEGFHPGASHLFDYPDRWVIEDSGQGAKDRNCATSPYPALAKGPMQFRDNQWAIYKNAAIEAGVRPKGYQPEVCNILDAIYAAAKKLRHDVDTFNDSTNCDCGDGHLTTSECASAPAPTDCNWEKGDVYHVDCHYYGNCSANYCATGWRFYQNYSCE